MKIETGYLYHIKDEFFDNIQEENYEFLKAPKNLKIIYEDENIILLDKKPGVIVHQDKSSLSVTIFV